MGQPMMPPCIQRWQRFRSRRRGWSSGRCWPGCRPRPSRRAFRARPAGRGKRRWSRWARGPVRARASTLAELIALVRAPVPAGIERVHPGWLRERLAPESSAVIRAPAGRRRRPGGSAARGRPGRPGDLDRARRGLAQGVAISAAGAAELRRRVFAGLVPLAEPGGPTGPVAAPLMTLSFAALVEAIEARGAETLGVSLRGAPPTTVARAAASLGGRLARTLLDAAAQPGPPDTREAARQLVARVADGEAGRFGGAPRRPSPGPRARSPGNENDRRRLAVAQRLPPALGRRLLAFAAEARGRGPNRGRGRTWGAS